MNAIKNITVGHTERLRKPVGFTMLANLVNIVPFCLSIEAVNVIFRACDGSGTPLDTARLWTIFGILAIYMAAMALAERAAYRANFRGAYEMSAEGRISLAEPPAQALARIPVAPRPGRPVVDAHHRFHDGRDGHLTPSAAVDEGRW